MVFLLVMHFLNYLHIDADISMQRSFWDFNQKDFKNHGERKKINLILSSVVAQIKRAYYFKKRITGLTCNVYCKKKMKILNEKFVDCRLKSVLVYFRKTFENGILIS